MITNRGWVRQEVAHALEDVAGSPRLRGTPSLPVWQDDNEEVAAEPVECVGGQVWNTCGKPCDATCSMPRPVCAALCVARCECPPHLPIWDGTQCIRQALCPRSKGRLRGSGSQ
jgi:hypothetical protein